MSAQPRPLQEAPRPVEAHIPRRARPPWAKPDVLVVCVRYPTFLRAEPGFHHLTPDALRQLADAPELGRRGRRRAPIVAVDGADELDGRVAADLERLRVKGIEVVALDEVVVPRCRVLPLTQLPEQILHARPRAIAARVLDLAIAVPGIVVLAALMPAIALAIWLEDRGPVFYVQERIGRGGRRFKLFKFRTMRPDAESYGPAWAKSNDERVTRIGGWLRRYKLDELPQFVNVITGSMSVVGPRPERPFFVEVLRRHIPGYDLRHSIRPGMTGWGTLRVGYGNSIEAKYVTHQYDLYQMVHGSVWFDLAIALKSVRVAAIGSERLDRFML